MPVEALFLVLVAAALHATWNYQLKKANAGRELWTAVYTISAAVTVPALLFFDPEALSRITSTGWLVICLSAPIHTLYALTLQTGYRKADYSVVYPVARGTGPLISVMAGVLILGNRPSVAGCFGIAAILLGIVFLTMKSDGVQKERIRTGLIWGALTGLCIAGYSFCDAWAVQQETGLTPCSFYFPSLIGRVILLAPFTLASRAGRKALTELFQNPVKAKALACITVGSPGAYLLVLFALTFAPLSYVAPSREVGMMAGVILGAMLLKEKLTKTRLAGVALMVAGVLLIATGG